MYRLEAEHTEALRMNEAVNVMVFPTNPLVLQLRRLEAVYFARVKREDTKLNRIRLMNARIAVLRAERSLKEVA